MKTRHTPDGISMPGMLAGSCLSKENTRTPPIVAENIAADCCRKESPVPDGTPETRVGLG
jgi:hypothetical protein